MRLKIFESLCVVILFYLMVVSCYDMNPYSMYNGSGYNLLGGPYLGVNPFYTAANNSYSYSSTPTKKEKSSEEVKQNENSSNDDSSLKMSCLMCNGTGIGVFGNMICTMCGGTGYTELRIDMNAIANGVQVNGSATNNLPVTVSPSNTQQNNSNNTQNKRVHWGTTSETCHMCQGSGKCNSCNGKHWFYSPFGDDKLTCPNCTDGKCSKCHGTGKVSKTTHDYY